MLMGSEVNEHGGGDGTGVWVLGLTEKQQQVTIGMLNTDMTSTSTQKEEEHL